MKRIIMHWPAGTNRVNPANLKKYHGIMQGDCTWFEGELHPEANEDTRDGKYAAHTRALNTGSIGLAMAGMFGARHSPFDPGQYPLNQKQVDAFVKKVAEYADTYNIAITRRTVLTHAEVQPTLGVRQNHKWDITWLPGWDKPRDPVEAGDALRKMIQAELDKLRPAPKSPSVPPWLQRIMRRFR